MECLQTSLLHTRPNMPMHTRMCVRVQIRVHTGIDETKTLMLTLLTFPPHAVAAKSFFHPHIADTIFEMISPDLDRRHGMRGKARGSYLDTIKPASVHIVDLPARCVFAFNFPVFVQKFCLDTAEDKDSGKAGKKHLSGCYQMCRYQICKPWIFFRDDLFLLYCAVYYP